MIRTIVYFLLYPTLGALLSVILSFLSLGMISGEWLDWLTIPFLEDRSVPADFIKNFMYPLLGILYLYSAPILVITGLGAAFQFFFKSGSRLLISLAIMMVSSILLCVLLDAPFYFTIALMASNSLPVIMLWGSEGLLAKPQSQGTEQRTIHLKRSVFYFFLYPILGPILAQPVNLIWKSVLSENLTLKWWIEAFIETLHAAYIIGILPATIVGAVAALQFYRQRRSRLIVTLPLAIILPLLPIILLFTIYSPFFPLHTALIALALAGLVATLCLRLVEIMLRRTAKS